MKGVIGIQFNWIFALIVGMVLLGLFVVQIDNASKKSRYEASLSLRESLQGMLVSTTENNYKEIKLGLVSVFHTCDDSGANFYLGTGSLPLETTYFALHAPRRISSRILHRNVIDDVPMLTGNDHKYLFVDSSTNHDEIMKYFNLLNASKQLISWNEITEYPPKDSNFKYTMIWYLPRFNPGSVEYNSAANNFDIIVISPGVNQEDNLLYFSTKYASPSYEHEKYLSDGEVIGGIIDSNIEIYSCIHKLQKEKEIRQLLLLDKRTELLSADSDDENCNSLFSYGRTIIDRMINELNQDNIKNYLLSEKSLEELNRDLARNSCPLIR